MYQVVFSKTLKKSKWDTTFLAKGDLIDEITNLKKQEGKDIIAYGGATLVSALIRHQLVDEFHLFVNPAAIGKGLTIFNELEHTQNLTLLKATPFDCGIVVLKYGINKSMDCYCLPCINNCFKSCYCLLMMQLNQK